MKHRNHKMRWLACLVCGLSLSWVAPAAQRGVTPGGIDYVSGGVAEAEEEDLLAQKKDFSFWLTTASKGSGGFLADVQVRIVNERGGQTVLEHTLDGPWLFAKLPPGRYRIEATFRESTDKPAQTLKRLTTIGKGDHRQMILYFDTSDRVRNAEDAVPPRPNPYAAP